MVGKGHTRWHGRAERALSPRICSAKMHKPCHPSIPDTTHYPLLPGEILWTCQSLQHPHLPPHSEGLCTSPWVCQCGRSLGPRSVLVPCPQPGHDSASTEPQFLGPPPTARVTLPVLFLCLVSGCPARKDYTASMSSALPQPPYAVALGLVGGVALGSPS